MIKESMHETEAQMKKATEALETDLITAWLGK